jgi:hypothetical protein
VSTRRPRHRQATKVGDGVCGERCVVWKWFRREFWDSVELEGLSALGRVENVLGARVTNNDWVDEGAGMAGRVIVVRGGEVQIKRGL